MMNYEMVPEPKTSADLAALLDEVQQSKFIGEITPDEVRDLVRGQTIRFFYDGEALIGFAAWLEISHEWREVGPIYIAQAYRGQGLGRTLFDMVVELNTQTPHKLYGVTKNPRVKPMFARAGFRQVALWRLSPVIWVFLLRKLTLSKLAHHLRKFDFADSMAHYVRPMDM